MWETIKNAVMGVKDATGIEIPGLPSDLGSLGDSVTESVQTVTESATGVIDGASAATEGVTDSLAGVSETAASAADTAAQELPDSNVGSIGANPQS
jgi:phage-related protein